MLTLYGIPNCDTCRKARRWLVDNDVAHRFHDLREDGVDRDMLRHWSATINWHAILNTRSTTWRGLDESDRQDLTEEKALELMFRNPTLIKRPVIDTGDSIQVGFSPESFSKLLG